MCIFKKKAKGLPDDQKVKVGIVGFGGMAGYHLRKMRESGLFLPVGAYDIDPARLVAAKKEGLKAYNTFEELADDKSLEVVLIATPNDVHEYYAVKIAEAKKNIICEKPVTLSSVSFNNMITAASENGVKLVVHQNRRWDGDYLSVKKILDSGKLDGVYKIESYVMGSHGLPGAWRKEKAHGGGMLLDWGVHLIDQALNVTDSPVTGVTCRFSFVYGFDCDDGIDVILDYANGFQYRVVVDTNSFISLPRWQVYGKNGTACIKNWSGLGKIVSVKIWDDKTNKGIVAGNGFTKTMANRSRSTVRTSPAPREKSNWMAFYQGYYNMLREGAPQLVSNESVMRCMRVMEACFRSDVEKKRIDVII